MWDLFLEPFRYPFMVRALVAGVAVGVTGAVVGSFLLVRRWSLLGDAISHAVLPGVALSYLLGWPYFVGALATALLTALGIGFLERNTRLKSDAAMGILFIGAFALGLAVLSRVRSSVDVFHILFGNVLGVSRQDLILAVAVSLAVLAVVVALFKELQLWAFDPLTAEVMGLPVRALHYLLMLLLSATIVAALRAVGIVLALAMLVTPPAAAYLLTHRLSQMIVLAAGLGAVSAVVGLYLSFYLNLASGPAMVLVVTGAFVLALLFAPEQGLVARLLERRRVALQVALDDVLKAVEELGEGQAGARPAVAVADVVTRTGLPARRVARLLRRLHRAGLAAYPGPHHVQLSDEGVRRARSLIRSHRLWERYLTDVAGMSWEQVHAEAHRLEHATPPGLAAELAEALGHPARDPHGAPIPTPEGELPAAEGVPLSQLAPGTWAEVMRVEDEDPDLLRRLREMGLVPGARVRTAPATGPDAGKALDVFPDGAPARRMPVEEAARVRVQPIGAAPVRGADARAGGTDAPASRAEAPAGQEPASDGPPGGGSP